jgi:Invasin, domain 3
MKLRAYSTLLSAFLILPAIVSCDKATPVAPDGAIISITASPSQIPLDGTSVITVIGRKPDGQPLNPGTEIRFNVGAPSGSGGGGGMGGGGMGGSGGSGGSTTGSATATGPSIEPAITEIRNGVATAVFRGGSSPGSVSVTASTGGSISVTTAIQVGAPSGAKPTLTVTANPNSVSVGGTSTITIRVRNADGTSAGAGEVVTLTSNLGSFSPARPQTNSNGIATTTFRAGDQPGTVTISAIVGTSDEATGTLTIRDNLITLIAVPTSVDRSINANQTISLTARITNSSGEPVAGAQVTFQSPVGVFTGSGVITVSTNADGLAVATLTVRPVDIDPPGITSFDIIATSPSGGATPLTATQTITVTGT